MTSKIPDPVPVTNEGAALLELVKANRKTIADLGIDVRGDIALGTLTNRLGPLGVNPTPPVTSDLPTVTWGTTATVSGRVESPNSSNVTILGRKGTWDTTNNRISIGAYYTAREFFMDGDTVEFSWIEATANFSRWWFWVDDEPVTAAPVAPGVSTSAGVEYFTKLVFGSARRRKITIQSANLHAWRTLRFPVATTITATPPKPLILIVSDSFCAGSVGAAMLQAVAVTLGRLLGADIVNNSIGGTGYLAGSETFGSAARVTRGAERTPDLIVFLGSVNESTSTGLNTAATAAYDAFAAAIPNVPMIVFGVQPSNATDTIGTSRAARNDAVRQAALAHPSVIAFHDMIGFTAATPPAAYNSGTSYTGGDKVTYQGSIWQVDPIVTTTFTNGAPGVNPRWQLLTYAYTGTGQVGTTTGDGTRDVMLWSDGIHPTVEGATAIAQAAEIAIRGDLLALA